MLQAVRYEMAPVTRAALLHARVTCCQPGFHLASRECPKAAPVAVTVSLVVGGATRADERWPLSIYSTLLPISSNASLGDHRATDVLHRKGFDVLSGERHDFGAAEQRHAAQCNARFDVSHK